MPWRLVKLLWLCLLACAATAAAASHCERVRVPRASVEHELVHLASFENAYEQARRLVADWGMPAYKTEGVSRQLFDALEDMAVRETSEALVNLTLDHTLSYEVTVATGADATPLAQPFVLKAERPLNETVRAFCERLEIDDCDELYAQLFALVVRDWGCHDDATNTPATASAADISSTVHLDMPRAAGSGHAAPLEGQALPILTIQVDGQMLNVTVRNDQELELQAAVLCRQWRTECANVMEAMRQLTLDHPAFSQKKAPGEATPRSRSGLALEISEPVHSRLQPRSERVYFNGAWLDGAFRAVDGRRHVCLFYGNDPKPQICGPFPPEEMWFFERNSLREGYHVVHFIEPLEGAVGKAASGRVLAARHFWVVSPTVKLLDLQLRTLTATALIVLTVETVAFDLFDPEFRVCALIDDVLECFQPRHLHVEEQTHDTPPHRRITVFRAPFFQLSPGKHTALLLLLNSFNQAFAHSDVATFQVTVDPHMGLEPRNPSYFFEPASASHIQRPATCPTPIEAAGLAWICNLWRHEWGRFSQNGEDGILQSIFFHVGTTTKSFVEFGTEDARECNTRLLREAHGWHGLLLDGNHANATINLHQEWISPENINELFAKYDVPREIDLLSIDVDFNDYWILDAIDRTRFSPRVVMIEVNAHVPPDEPRVVKYTGPSARWDGKTAYFGVGVGAVHVWGKRNGYSLVYCESHGVNCFLIRDDVLASVISGDDELLVVSDVLTAEDLHAPPNFFGRNASYPWPTHESGIVEEWDWLQQE